MPTKSATRSRHLGRQHFAFFRGLLEGLPVEAIWDRYLSVEGQKTDLRLVPTTIAWIRAELVAAARREQRPGTARLLRMDVQRLVNDAPCLPTLEEFAEYAGLEDEPQGIQIQAFEQHYGSPSGRRRHRAQLLHRQLAALRWLEHLVAREPAAGDAVTSWLRPELAEFLGQAGIFTVAQLAERINGIGLTWWRSIRGIGPVKGARITQWTAANSGSIGIPIGRHTQCARPLLCPRQLAKVVAPASNIRPIEKFVVPVDLDGRHGRFRRPQSECLLQADNDYDAILTWLRSKRGLERPVSQTSEEREAMLPESLKWMAKLSNTQRSYRKEAERFLLWAILRRRKALSSITAEDCIDYAAFLGDPCPRSQWCGPRSRERWSPLWRPFEGPLSTSAQRQALTVLKSLYAFLVDQNYLMGNPWSAAAVPRGGHRGLDLSRSLTREQWTLVRSMADCAGHHSTAIRLRLTLDLLYATGLRASEAVSARASDLRRVNYYDADSGHQVSGWVLLVVGKGHKLREVPVPDELVAHIGQYLGHRGLAENVEAAEVEGAYILARATDIAERASALAMRSKVDPLAGITEATLYRQLKAHFDGCASALRSAGDELQARRLRRASTHWLRHTHASHALASGVKIEEAQQNLGHASLATTTTYLTTEQARRLQSMNKFWDHARKGSSGHR